MMAHIQERRDALAAQIAQARIEYDDREAAIAMQQRELAMLRRSIDAMHGGLQELEALLARTDGDEPPA